VIQTPLSPALPLEEPDFRRDLPSACDVAVIGAGPAGLRAAIALRELGIGNVVLLDRRDPWREPVACAEGVRLPPLRRLSPVDFVPWIRTGIDHLRVATETASFVWSNPGDGVILDRARMHRDLSLHAARLGAQCHFRTSAQGVSPLRHGIRTLSLLREGTHCTLEARAVIDASGPGRGLGWEEGLAGGDADLETAAFALVEGLAHPVDTIAICLSQRFAPGGYAWIFPSCPGKANVGVVCGRGTRVTARQGLALYLEHLQPGSATPKVYGGAIPCGSGSGTIAQDRLFKAGDAASMVHPISRAGILQAMEAGLLAASAAAASLRASSQAQDDRAHQEYRRRWKAVYGQDNLLAGWAKPLLSAVPDATLSHLFRILDRAPGIRRPRHVRRTVLFHLPAALWAGLREAFAP
jgi:flavin-dependent dehydrogenase